MKKFRKLTAMITALCMAGCMMTTMSIMNISADTTYSITIENTVSGHTYEAYQIFDGDYSEGILSNIKWGSNVDTSTTSNLLTDIQAISIANTGDDSETNPTIKPFANLTTASAIAEKLAEYNDNTEVPKLFAKVVGKHLTGTALELVEQKSTVDDTTTGYKVNITNPGYYLVKDKAKSVPDGSTGTEFILQVVGEATATPKIATPSVLKKVLEDDKYTSDGGYGTSYNDVADYNIGETVPFELIGSLPSNLNEYDTYYYQFNDTLGNEFNIDLDSIKVYVLNPTVSQEEDGTTTITYNYNSLGTALTTGYEKSSSVTAVDTNNDGTNDANKFNVWFKDITSVAGVTADSKIVVRYNATLNENAKVGLPGQQNAVDLTYSNNPTNSGEGNYSPTTPPDDTDTTPEDEVIVFTYELDITKYDGATSGSSIKYLKDAEFMLYTAMNEDGKDVDASTAVKIYQKESTDSTTDVKYYDYMVWDETVAESEDGNVPTGWTEATTLKTHPTNGKITIKGLDDGTYYLKETKAPAGYNELEAAVKLTIKATTVNNQEWDSTPSSALTKIELIDKYGTNIDVKNDTNKGIVETLIANNKGSTLPSTGGIGTTIFYMVGGVLVVGAGVTLISKKRMKNNEQ